MLLLVFMIIYLKRPLLRINSLKSLFLPLSLSLILSVLFLVLVECIRTCINHLRLKAFKNESGEREKERERGGGGRERLRERETERDERV